MGNHQSFRDVFVINNPTLLRSGFTTDLGVNQAGFFTADPKTDDKAVYPPDPKIHKVLQLIQGTPELPTGLLSAVANQSKRSKPIKIKNIIDWKGRKAERGQSRVVAIGFDGIDTNKTLQARCDETRTVFVKLSGGPIDELFHTDGKGFVEQFSIYSGCCDDCGDDCSYVSANKLADDLVKQVNEHPRYQMGTRGNNRVIKAKKVLSSGAQSADATCYVFRITVCDDGSDVSLGIVQSQYPGSQIVRVDRTGSNSTYEVVKDTNSTPAQFNNSGIVTITDCPICPSGYTLSSGALVYKVQREDAGDATALTNVKSAYSIAASNEAGNRISYEYGQSTYILVSNEELTVSGQDVLTFIGETRDTCVLTSPSNISWVSAGTLNRFNKTYRITIKDNQCGVSRFSELAAAYPSLTITQIATGATTCTHRFETTILSNCVPAGCPPDAPQWIAPQAFEGMAWEEVPATQPDASVKVGVIFESAYVDREVTKENYDYWSFEIDPIYIEVSEHSYDWNDTPTMCKNEWPVTVLQEIKLPLGNGARVMAEEEFFKGYEGKYRDLHNPIATELHDAVIQADPKKYYDQYSLKYSYDYHQSWFSEKRTDYYILEIYVPQGTGKEIETAVNSIITHAGVDIEPVVL